MENVHWIRALFRKIMHNVPWNLAETTTVRIFWSWAKKRSYNRGKKDTPATKEVWSKIAFFKWAWQTLKVLPCPWTLYLLNVRHWSFPMRYSVIQYLIGKLQCLTLRRYKVQVRGSTFRVCHTHLKNVILLSISLVGVVYFLSRLNNR